MSDQSSLDMVPEAEGTRERAYQPLPRRLRPQRFSDLVGQDLCVQLIQRAFQTGRMAHAFLFTGIRGVGKTTLARLLAKLLNCTQPVRLQKEGRELSEPCGTCASCEATQNDQHADVTEMDAASHTGVDDVRKVLEACHYRPLLGRYKVFIVDEVHMLSKSAFNAFLKTLEAPPAHVVFIFATTEPAKIPLTVLSRCLRFDLCRMAIEALQTYLTKICQQEGVTPEAEAMKLLAEAADGSARDGVSLLDQALLWVKGEDTKAATTTLSEVVVRQLLGLQDVGLVADILLACTSYEAPRALSLFRTAYQQGADPLMLLDQMAAKVHAWATTDPSKAEGASTVSDMLTRPLLGRLWQMLMQGREELARSPFPHLAFEMLVVRLAYATQLPAPESLLVSPLPAVLPQKTEVSPDPAPMSDKKKKEAIKEGKTSAEETSMETSPSTARSPLLEKAKTLFPNLKVSDIKGKEEYAVTRDTTKG